MADNGLRTLFDSCSICSDVPDRHLPASPWPSAALSRSRLSGCFVPPFCQQLSSLIDKMAWNSHEVWAKERRAQGFRYGKKRDARRKQHPMMLPYEFLSDKDKKWDRTTAEEVLKLIVALGYKLKRVHPKLKPAPLRSSSRTLLDSDGTTGLAMHIIMSFRRTFSLFGRACLACVACFLRSSVCIARRGTHWQCLCTLDFDRCQ
jgi:hypothetical protein